MKKKNHILRIAGLLFLLAMITNFALTGTLAKYTASSTGSAQATVAKFSVNIGTSDIAKGQTVSVNLFDTIYELDASGNVTGTPEATSDVVLGKIAPGTGGKFQIDVTNNSDVKVIVSFSTPTITNASNVPLEFSIDNTTWNTSLTSVLTAATLTIDAGNTTTSQLATIYWRWAFSTSAAGDTADSLLGTAAVAPTVTINLPVTVTQVD